MASLNKATLIGNLGRDPEVRYMPSGDAVVNMAIATTDKWKDKNTGEPKEATEWHRVNFFGKLAEVCGQYLKKGSQVYVEGKIVTRKYTDKDGVEKFSTEVVLQNYRGELTMLGGRGDGGGMGGSMGGGGDEFGQSSPMDRPRAGAGGRATIPARDLDDEVPF